MSKWQTLNTSDDGIDKDVDADIGYKKEHAKESSAANKIRTSFSLSSSVLTSDMWMTTSRQSRPVSILNDLFTCQKFHDRQNYTFHYKTITSVGHGRW